MAKNIRLTLFQRKVYRVVKRIPFGEVRTYKWVAEQIGSPRAYRAVGNALNKNPYPDVVPCHRVVGADGNLRGFSKGVDAKYRLLKAEGLTADKIRDIIRRYGKGTAVLKGIRAQGDLEET